MNIIGLIVPKIVFMLTIWIPSIGMKNKIILSVLMLIKLIVDYDIARPGHNGNFYKLTQKVEFEVGELIIACVKFLPDAFFLTATALMNSWIPFIPGVIGSLIDFVSIVCCVKDVFSEGK